MASALSLSKSDMISSEPNQVGLAAATAEKTAIMANFV
jgi:hypothetical protein